MYVLYMYLFLCGSESVTQIETLLRSMKGTSSLSKTFTGQDLEEGAKKVSGQTWWGEKPGWPAPLPVNEPTGLWADKIPCCKGPELWLLTHFFSVWSIMRVIHLPEGKIDNPS